MKVFKYFPPYTPAGRCSFPETKKRSGVYLIKENGKLVYVGFSNGDLYKTLYRHFQKWTDQEYRGTRVISARDRVTYHSKMKRHKYTVRVIMCTGAQAARLEKALIINYQPRDNSIKYESYQVTIQDARLEDAYYNAPVERECPF